SLSEKQPLKNSAAFRDNIDELKNYIIDGNESSLPFSKWILSCPLFLCFLNMKDSCLNEYLYSFEDFLGFDEDKINTLEKVNQYDFLAKIGQLPSLKEDDKTCCKVRDLDISPELFSYAIPDKYNEKDKIKNKIVVRKLNNNFRKDSLTPENLKSFHVYYSVFYEKSEN
ncbi:MAG: hypothetical protein ACTTH9_06850, partial [Porphyromonas gingivalis]